MEESTLQEIVGILKYLADEFWAIRMDWSDPRANCRGGISAAQRAIKILTNEDYTPKLDEDGLD